MLGRTKRKLTKKQRKELDLKKIEKIKMKEGSRKDILDQTLDMNGIEDLHKQFIATIKCLTDVKEELHNNNNMIINQARQVSK